MDNQKQDGAELAQATAAVSQAYPNADPAIVARNTFEINKAAAEAAKPKLVRDLILQRIEEAQYEVKRLQDILANANPALLDVTLDDAHKIFA